MEHSLLVEKYRPTKLENFVGNENIKKAIQQYLNNGDIQNFIFYSSAGTGKTTLAKLIVKNLDCDYLYINASDERGIETIRDKVSGFASVASFKSIKVIILDEADFLTIQAQASLRNIIETFSRTTRFILTCNFVERIIDPLQSRCQVLRIVPPSKQEVAYHLVEIFKSEGINCSNDNLKYIINQNYPDVRKMLNTIQLSNQNGDIVVDKKSIVSSNYVDLVLDELKKSKPNWKTIRKIIANANVNDFEELFKVLYDKSEEYSNGNDGLVAVLINEYSYQSNFRLDKEINAMALIQKIIENTKKQVL